MEDRIRRITEMERHLNRITAWLEDRSGDVSEDVRLLDAYYRSPEWRLDFEADEAGELPAGLPRGVLSEDAVYDILEAYEYMAPPPEKSRTDTGNCCFLDSFPV